MKPKFPSIRFFSASEVTMFRAKITRLIATMLSTLLVAGIVLPVSSQAQYAEDLPSNALSYGYGGELDLRLLANLGLLEDSSGNGIEVADLDGTEQSWLNGVAPTPDSPNPQPAAAPTLGVSALNDVIYLNLEAVRVPLVGDQALLEFLLDDGGLGAVHEYANAKTPNEAYGAVGLVSGTPATVEISKDDNDGVNEPYAKVNLISLLNLYSNSTFTSTVINEASLNLGVLGSKAEYPNTPGETTPALCAGEADNQVNYAELNHSNLNSQYFIRTDGLTQDDQKFCTGYRIADANVVVDAPIVKNIMTNLNTALLGLENTIETTLKGSNSLTSSILGLLGYIPLLGDSLANRLSLDYNVTIPVADIVNEIVAKPLSDGDPTSVPPDESLVSIDLESGEILINLQQLHNGDLSNLDPNTPLISADELTEILNTVTGLLTGSAADYPNGLVARVENTLNGTTTNGVKSRGIYDTQVDIDLTLAGLDLPGTLLDLPASTLGINGTLGGLLSNSASNLTITSTGLFFALSGLNSLVTGIASLVGTTVEELLINTIITSTSTTVNTVVGSLEPVLRTVLQPLANAIVNRQSVQQLPQGNLFTVAALELHVLSISDDPLTPSNETSAVRLPLATSAVMAQSWDLINLDVNVAKIGNGRGLYTGGYAYDLICTADRWTGIDADNLVYPSTNVGDGYSFSSNNLTLNAVTGGLSSSIQVVPDAVCTITESSPTTAGYALAANENLRATGGSGFLARTPYTYFLNANGSGVDVSSTVDDITELTKWTSAGVTLGSTVTVDSPSIGNQWKNNSLTFKVPSTATTLSPPVVNIVHAYDIETRDIEVSKAVVGDATPTSAFNFQYSINGGVWSTINAIPAGGKFTIEDVPVLKSDLSASIVSVREVVSGLPAELAVSWAVGTGTPVTGTTGGGHSTSPDITVNAGLTAEDPTTPNILLTATNTFPAPVSVDFEAMLPATGRTSLVWVLGLGILAALGAVIMYIRSRRQ